MPEILHKQLSYTVFGAALEVHKILGSGFLEVVYQRALAYELSLRNIVFKEQVYIPATYKNIPVGDYSSQDKFFPALFWHVVARSCFCDEAIP